MIYFYQGNTLSAITRRILAALPQKPEGRHIVLVPDRFTLEGEEAVLASRLATMHVEVLPFSRFADTVLPTAECLTPEGCTMILAEALRRAEKDLVYYHRACGIKGFVNAMYSSIVALRNSGITPERLRISAEKMPPSSANKTRDIATIAEQYLKVLSGGKIDPTTRLNALAKGISTCEWLRDTCIYVVDFYCFNKVQYEVLGELMAHVKELHIGYIAESVGRDNRRIYPHDLRENLLALAKEKGVFSESVRAFEVLPAHKQVIEESIFGYRLTDDPLRLTAAATVGDRVRLFPSPDPESELHQVCREIVRLVKEHGYRYRDVAIVAPDPLAYAVGMEHIFADYRIPVFCNEVRLLSDEAPVRYLLDCMDCLLHNCDFEHVMAVVKSGFFPCSFDQVDCFENYCLTYAIDYSRFTSPFTLGGEVQGLSTAETVRRHFQKSLPVALPTEGSVHDYVDVLFAWLEDQRYDSRITAFYERQNSMGFIQEADRTAQVPERMRGVLELLSNLLGEEVMTLAEFYQLLESSLQGAHLRLLPSTVDCVYVGEAKDSHYGQIKALFVLGTEDGLLPADPQAGSILSDDYFHVLQLQDLVVQPTPKDQGRYARFYLEQLLLLPQEYLYVSYIKKEERDPVPLLVDGLSRLLSLPTDQPLCHTTADIVANREHIHKVLLTHKDMEESLRRQLYALMSPEDKSRYDALHRAMRDSLLPETGLFFNRDHTSISQLECYFSCPYRHFVQYGLRATERKEAGLDVREIGTVLHSMLELFFSRYTDQLDTLSEEELAAARTAVIDEVLAEQRLSALNRSEQRSFIDRIRREAEFVLKEEILNVKTSQFKPFAFEVHFGGDKEGDYPGITLSSGISLSGYIDRIDKKDNQVTVIDYKSGADHFEIKYIYYGLKVQLYTYLGSLKASGYQPVGGFYRPVGAVSKKESKLPRSAMRGQVIMDEALICSLDPTLESSSSSRLLPIERDEKGELIPAGDKKKYVPVSKEQFDDLISYVFALMDLAVKRIREGYISANPMKGACQYCNCKYMCPMGENTPARVDNVVDVDVVSSAVRSKKV